MKRTANPNLKQLISQIADNVKSKRSKQGIKALGKLDLSSVLALPYLASKVIKDLSLVDSNQVNILVHNVHNHDYVDHLRWFAMVPLMIGRPDLRVNVIATVAPDSIDAQTQFRPIIDRLIKAELKDNFSSEIVDATLSEVIANFGDDHFDVVINNIASFDSVMNEDDMECIHELVGSGVPYVVSDISPLILLYRLQSFLASGISSQQADIQSNENGFYFSKEGMTASYRHVGHYIVLDSIESGFRYDAGLFQSFRSTESAITQRMNNSDSLTKLPVLNGDSLILFTGVEYDIQNQRASVIHSGDKYSFNYEFIGDSAIFAQKGDIAQQSNQVYLAFHNYCAMLQQIESLKVGAA